jgi:putative chitinase
MAEGFTFDFTEDQLKQIITGNDSVSDWYSALLEELPKYDINTPERVACFIGQCAHESANFKILNENLNYRWESLRRVFGKYFPTDDLAKQYEKQPERIANRVYGSRMGNGDEYSGDGWKFHGRGLIQLTGHNNYDAFATSIGKPLNEVPAYLATFEGAVASACWFWNSRNLNTEADQLDHKTITKLINGGDLGLDERIEKSNHALELFTGTSAPVAEAVIEIVKQGMKGAVVKQVQTALGLTADGDFGPGTAKAVMEWQAANGLVADGIVGPKSLKLLLG